MDQAAPRTTNVSFRVACKEVFRNDRNRSAVSVNWVEQSALELSGLDAVRRMQRMESYYLFWLNPTAALGEYEILVVGVSTWSNQHRDVSLRVLLR